jgi:hypothetical protein
MKHNVVLTEGPVVPFPVRVPDIGDLVDCPNDRKGVVTGWLKALPDPEHDYDTDEYFNSVVDNSLSSADPLGDLLTTSMRRFGPDKKYLAYCTKKDAEYVSTRGAGIQRVADVTVTGKVSWPADSIRSYIKRALQRAGQPFNP